MRQAKEYSMSYIPDGTDVFLMTPGTLSVASTRKLTTTVDCGVETVKFIESGQVRTGSSLSKMVTSKTQDAQLLYVSVELKVMVVVPTKKKKK